MPLLQKETEKKRMKMQMVENASGKRKAKAKAMAKRVLEAPERLSTVLAGRVADHTFKWIAPTKEKARGQSRLRGRVGGLQFIPDRVQPSGELGFRNMV